MVSDELVLWGSRLSPFALKAMAMLRHVGAPFRFLPGEGRLLENYRTALRVERIKAGKLAISYPQRDPELDELPLVPYLLGPAGENLYDSSAMGEWLDARHGGEAPRLLPAEGEDPAVGFAARLIDEYFDELGLYMAHHNRWVLSATDNDAGRRLAREFRFVSFVRPRRFAARFSARQVRRLPYLFSVAEPGFAIEGLAAERTPPSRPGFPPTHALLDECFARMLERMELILSDQHYLLGDRFTIADASAYGQLAMNFDDPSAADLIFRRAPLTYGWVERIERGDTAPRGSNESGGLAISSRLKQLLGEIGRTFVPLMRQNEEAYRRERERGQRTFNESAFDRGEALYDGEIDGVPFRSVVKTFQVAVWRRLQARWQELSPQARATLGDVMGPA